MVTIQELQFEVVENIKDGWDEEAFKARYSDILNKYDYIVGDWGYNQLRLRGFLKTNIRNQHMILRLVRCRIIFMSIVILDARILS